MSTGKLSALLTFVFAASLGFTDGASDVKTYDQAWPLQGQDGQGGIPGTDLQANERYIRGANRMKR